MINMIHDELGTEQPYELKDLVAEKLKFFMEEAGKEYCPIIPLKAEPEITEYWKH
jgi:DNA polymerase I-like protein with 3'-5' exonuclease and polymerase domains